ncbi:MAG TPA: Ig-like domain-containing protein, partial [Longimicrobium sp.]|nr:Ig-like domain-containing protein [Longimicrobium sp.]
MTLSADTTYIAPGDSVQLTAPIGNAASSVAAYRSLNEAVASVNGAGLVAGRSVGVARIVAESGRLADTLQINVMPSPRRAVATGYSHTCVLDVAGQAHCWGLNAAGQLGNGTTASSAAPVAVVGG